MYECSDQLDKHKYDFSFGDTQATKELKRINLGWKVKKILTTPIDVLHIVDTNGHKEEKITGAGPISEYIILGDTKDNDLGESFVEVKIGNIEVLLEEVGDCNSN